MSVALSSVCRQAELSASVRSVVQRSPTECDVSGCDRKVSIMRSSWLTRGRCTMKQMHGETLAIDVESGSTELF